MKIKLNFNIGQKRQFRIDGSGYLVLIDDGRFAGNRIGRDHFVFVDDPAPKGRRNVRSIIIAVDTVFDNIIKDVDFNYRIANQKVPEAFYHHVDRHR